MGIIRPAEANPRSNLALPGNFIPQRQRGCALNLPRRMVVLPRKRINTELLRASESRLGVNHSSEKKPQRKLDFPALGQTRALLICRQAWFLLLLLLWVGWKAHGNAVLDLF